VVVVVVVVCGGMCIPVVFQCKRSRIRLCQVERDLMIWNNKRYVSRPLYVKSREDSLVQRHRRWYAQFYSEHSPRLDSAAPDDDKLDW